MSIPRSGPAPGERWEGSLIAGWALRTPTRPEATGEEGVELAGETGKEEAARERGEPGGVTTLTTCAPTRCARRSDRQQEGTEGGTHASRARAV